MTDQIGISAGTPDAKGSAFAAWPAIGLYLAITAALSGLVYALVLNFGIRPYVAILMWMPAISVYLTFKMLGIPLKSLGFNWPRSRYILLAILLPFLYGLIAYGFMWTAGLAGAVSAKFIDHAHTYLGLPRDWDDSVIVIVAVLVTASSWMMWHIPSALGEEIGWRGYLTPAVGKHFGFLGTSFFVGTCWFIWHLPLLLFTKYGGAEAGLFALMNYGIMVYGLSVILTWLRSVSGSVWPAAFLHGAHNLFILETFARMSYDVGDTKLYAGEFGLVLPVVIGLLAALVWWKKPKFAEDPAP